MTTTIPVNKKELTRLLRRGEGPCLEFNRSTCAFLNGSCRAAGIAPPEFEEITGAAVVTFRAPVGVTAQVTPQVTAVLEAATHEAKSREELQNAAGIKDREHFRKSHLWPMISAGWLERTIPDKPNSRLQKYRLTDLGRQVIENRGG